MGRHPTVYPDVGLFRVELRPTGPDVRVPPSGFLEGFELWLPDPIPAVYDDAYITLRAVLEVNATRFDFDRIAARFRHARVVP